METKYSENVAVIPLNAAGALELGLHPCQYCKSGWGSYSATERKSCSDDCDFLKQFVALTVQNTISGIENTPIKKA